MHELERRASLASPEETVRGMFLNDTLRTLKELGEEALAARCLRACGQEKFVDFFSYPIGLQCQMFALVLPTLAERYGDGEEALRQLGRRAAASFLGSPAGRMMLIVAQRNPKLLLGSLPSAYRVALNHGHIHIEWLEAKHGLMVVKHDYMPHLFQEGVLLGMLDAMKVPGVRVHGRSTGGLDSESDFSWE
ncbi:DUF2378 family protein [Archangium gephyra]|uniref:TIGR02265 family protein n=1 Tax=Archangium gephyra TaxID=48 RepID=UPI0035D4BAD1